MFETFFFKWNDSTVCTLILWRCNFNWKLWIFSILL